MPPVAALFLVGSLWRRPGPGATLATLIGDHGLSITLFALTQTGLLSLHFTLVAGPIFGVSLLILVLAGFLGQPFVPAPRSVWTAAMTRPEEPQPWWQDYRAQSLVLLLMTAALVWAFRYRHSGWDPESSRPGTANQRHRMGAGFNLGVTGHERRRLEWASAVPATCHPWRLDSDVPAGMTAR